ncbi:glutathione synthetase-like isoform X1 [Topomyia yanbarensis]|uniref:glutathione synthetase-like isoform X1 n=1 Tax=Topomyia yanbarensis TaxID=2498891 RepID=UPI00273A7CD6|nr:glutathione synthetase-like isoform X1 [Topomyia yanbarensis]XP_058816203.1 glutathione synthetase-like isoform X1 [Topomyia yanbarensis]
MDTTVSDVPVLESCIPLPIETDQLLEVVEKAKDWAIMHGAAMRSKADFNPDALQFAPFILTPSSFPRKEFEKAVELQVTLNELMHAVSHDFDFLRETLQGTIKVDPFTRSLFEIFEMVLNEGISQPISLGLLRSDLMLETRCENECKVQCKRAKAYCCWKQVEINSIASGFGHLGPASKSLQSFILTELGHADKLPKLPENRALSGLCDAMVEAWKLQNRPHAAILFVIEDITYNICDQRFHEFYIREKYPQIQVIRRTLTQIHEQGKLGASGELLIGDLEAAVIYFRAGYEPGHYYGQNEWAARLLMERSQAIKCPSIQYHLAGTKKVQQALAKPGTLKRFISDERKIDTIKEIFTGLYSLDKNEQGDEAVKLALGDPERYVLKPQREGGGNNVYGADIPGALAKMAEDERSAWILMERIFPPVSKGYMVRPGGKMPPKIVNLVSELGIFGAIIGTKDKIVYNKQVGHMLRTKLSSANEGGVAAGLGALDSPYMID